MKLDGNLVVGQSGGPTAVVNASLTGVIEEAQRHAKIKRVYGMVRGVLELLDEDLLDLSKEDSYTIEGLKYTPSAALGSCRYKLRNENYEKALDIFKKYNIRYFLYIGGDDSMETTHRIR